MTFIFFLPILIVVGVPLLCVLAVLAPLYSWRARRASRFYCAASDCPATADCGVRQWCSHCHQWVTR